MGIFKKIWNWLFGKKEVESYEDIKTKCLKDVHIEYHTGGYSGTNKSEKSELPIILPKGYKVESGVTTRQQARRDSEDNFLTGAMVGYIIADILNDSPSARDIEVPKSSNYDSNYAPSSSSSYDSGGYYSSCDSDSSSSSCDSGC